MEAPFLLFEMLWVWASHRPTPNHTVMLGGRRRLGRGHERNLQIPIGVEQAFFERGPELHHQLARNLAVEAEASESLRTVDPLQRPAAGDEIAGQMQIRGRG